MFHKKTLIIVFVIVALGLVFGTFFLRTNQQQSIRKANAGSGTSTITAESEWEAGTLLNIDSTSSAGSIKINDLISSKYDLASLYASDPSKFSLTSDCSTTGSIANLIDGNLATSWEISDLDCTASKYSYFYIDFGESKRIFKVRLYGKEDIRNNGSFTLQSSEDGIVYQDAGTINIVSPGDPTQPLWYENNGINVNKRYYRFMTYGSDVDPPRYTIYEFEVYTSATATHTTGATQIDGGENFWQWETFTDSKTTPANTSVTYRYRTSANGTDWTSWVGSIGSVTSRTGDDSNNPTKYRYLQIEATLSNTDGASTPTIDSYSIGYHTNQKPNAPTAMTAVIN